jgi:hypothetical protein
MFGEFRSSFQLPFVFENIEAQEEEPDELNLVTNRRISFIVGANVEIEFKNRSSLPSLIPFILKFVVLSKSIFSQRT